MKNFIFPVFISLLFLQCSPSYEGNLVHVQPNKENGFDFPYFLFIPKDVPVNDKVYLILEPNNSGFADDDFDRHLEKAERTATNEFYLGNYLSNKLKYPLLAISVRIVPVISVG